MFKKLFCEHEYGKVLGELIGGNAPFIKRDYVTTLVCKKCGKKVYLSSNEIEVAIAKFKRKLKKRIADDDDPKLNIPVVRGCFTQTIFVKGLIAQQLITYFDDMYKIDFADLFKAEQQFSTTYFTNALGVEVNELFKSE